MASARLILSAALSLTISASVLPSVTFAQEAPAQGLETAKQQWFGLVNAGAVYVRSAASEDAYPVMKLEKGAQVKVVGMKFKWLKILPPEGTFAYVPQAYVQRRGDGKVGRATREIIAKVGSSLTQQKTNPMAKVEQGQDVQIVGEEDEYYKIQPPEGSYLYINQQYVDPYKPIGTPDAGEPKPTAPNTIAKNTPKPDGSPEGQAKTGIVDGLASEKGTAPTTQPGGDVAAAPATQPADPVTVASDTFDKLESDFKGANEKSITEQPIDQLLTGYQDLLKQDALPTSMRRIAESRVATLKLRGEAKADYLTAKAEQQKSMERRQALQAEKQEIEQRIKENQITVYAAVGTLRPSSLQRGNTMMYRLTDPATGRTVAYIRTNDSKYAGMLGQFIGVKGTINTDTALNMKFIDQPSEAKQIDSAKVNKTITAQIIPPSLVGNVRSASTNDAGE